MASARSIEAGRAFMRLFLDDDEFRRGLLKTQRNVQEFGRTLQGIGLGLAGVGAAIVAPFTLTVRAAANAQESLSRFKAVFGEQTQAAEKFAQTLANSVGRSVTEIRDGMSELQAMFQGLGFDPSQARQFSEQLSELAIDFASFNNISDDEAIGRFISAMSGSSEVLDRFGINLKASALNQEFLSRGMNVTTATASEQEKAIARLSIIMRSLDTNGVTGDAIRTADSFSNQMKKLQASIKNASEAIGTLLIPYLVPMLDHLTRAVTAISEFAQENETLVIAVAGTGAAFLATGLTIATFGKVLAAAAGGVKLLLSVLPALRVAMTAFVRTPAGLALVAIGAALVIGVAAWKSFTSETQAATKAVDEFAQAAENAGKASQVPRTPVDPEAALKRRAEFLKREVDLENQIQRDRARIAVELAEDRFAAEKELLEQQRQDELDAVRAQGLLTNEVRGLLNAKYDEELQLLERNNAERKRIEEEQVNSTFRSGRAEIDRLKAQLNLDGLSETLAQIEIDRREAIDNLPEFDNVWDRIIAESQIDQQADLRSRLARQADAERTGDSFADRGRAALQGLPTGGLASQFAGQIFGSGNFVQKLVSSGEKTVGELTKIRRAVENNQGLVGI